MKRVHGSMIAALLGVAVSASAAEIPVIGLDKGGHEVYRVVPRESLCRLRHFERDSGDGDARVSFIWSRED